ncbi:hypothetical protein LV457_04985 [Mycobacterium sp. MYCO198283]|uniref:hypothetical protein n=1 Tax=Mycobacterium sp. MYCO198283 TaxID=2883505 RepID=UPI001E4B137A|nr:hypothetical protein [Mycobacterium sp. MYCO198283]MCG5431646.1 hypothetical protein [Mycobacterium sp. MYCO198283]
MAPARTGRRSRALSGVLDQLFSSTSNGVIIFAVAVASTPQEFGSITILMTALVAVLGCLRGMLGTPLLLKADQSRERIRREGSYALTAALIIGPLLGLGMIVFGRGLGTAALCLGVAAPFVVAQDVLRYVLIAEGRPHVAAIWDGVWCVGTVAAFVATWLVPQVVTTTVLLAGWGALGVLAFLGLASDVRILPGLRGSAAWLRAGLGHRVRYGLDAGLEQVTVFLLLSLTTLLATATATAALRGATALLAPIGMFGTAVQLVLIPESTRRSAQPKQVWQALVRLSVLVAFATTVVGLLLFLLPSKVGYLLLGESWTLAQDVLPLMVLEYVSASAIVALAIYLRTFNRSGSALSLKVALSVTMLAGVAITAWAFKSGVGVAIGIALSSVLVAGVSYAWFTPWRPRPRAASVDIAAGAEPIEPLNVAADFAGLSDDTTVLNGIERAAPPVGSTAATNGHVGADGQRTAKGSWPFVAVRPATTLPRRLHAVTVRRWVPRSPNPALIGLWSFVVMGVLAPLYLTQLTPIPRDPTWIGPLLITMIAAGRFSWIMGTGERRLFEMMFWSFTYAFLGLAPLAQLFRDSWPVTVPRTDSTYALWAAIIVLVGMAAFLIGVGLDRQLIRRRPEYDPQPKRRGAVRADLKMTINYNRLMVLTVLTIALNLYYLSKVGVIQFMKSRDDALQALTAAWSPLSLAVFIRAGSYMSLIVSCVALVRYRREARIAARRGMPESKARMNLNLILILVVGVLLANSLNPVSNPRYLSGTAVLAVIAAAGLFATSLRFRLTAWGFLIGLLVIFPQADAFRYSAEANVELSNPIESLLTPDYDSFAQIINGYTVGIRDGIEVGNQILGVMLFFIPRAIWTGKAYDTGILIANGRGYPFTNLSAPLFIEFFLNGGWVVLVLAMFACGFFLHRWDSKLNRELALYSMPSILGCILPFYMLILLRGSLLQAAPYLFFTLLCAFYVTRRSRREDSAAATGAVPDRAPPRPDGDGRPVNGQAAVAGAEAPSKQMTHV